MTQGYINNSNSSLSEGEAIDITISSGIVTIAAETATDTNKGVSTLDENDFLVTAGDVTLANRTRLVPAYVENIGIDYNGGTGVFTVQGGSATLSATNPGYVTLQSKADPGELIVHEVTADQAFIDDAGSSEILNNLFGLTTSVAWAQDIPFFIYAVTNDAASAIAFMISRNPSATLSPAAANIGAPDDAVADAQGDFFSIDNLDETLYDTNPCICIGSFRMRMSSSDDWTVQTLSNADGIGNYHEQTIFIFPTGVNGAASGTYFKSNAGTEPVFSSNDMTYNIDRYGWVKYRFDGLTATAGVGSETIEPILPYIVGSARGSLAFGRYLNNDVSLWNSLMGNSEASDGQINQLRKTGGSVALSNAAVDTSDSIAFEMDYQAF